MRYVETEEGARELFSTPGINYQSNLILKHSTERVSITKKEAKRVTEKYEIGTDFHFIYYEEHDEAVISSYGLGL